MGADACAPIYWDGATRELRSHRNDRFISIILNGKVPPKGAVRRVEGTTALPLGSPKNTQGASLGVDWYQLTKQSQLCRAWPS